ncbi:MAG: hypothetical protein WCO63_13470 [Bacteroidota bacterium]
MNTVLLEGKSGYKVFRAIGRQVYCGNPFHRGTEAGVERLVLSEQTAFSRHATVIMFAIRDGNNLVGRFALIQDKYLPDYVQVSFFEAQAGLIDVFGLIRKEIARHFPAYAKVIVGLNGHLNYGAGFLLTRFEEAPVFGLPYTQPYYPEYFRELTEKRMHSFRFPLEGYAAWANTYDAKRSMKGLNVRYMHKASIRKEIAIYTQLNNDAFLNHPYWARREEADDFELFSPFRFFLKDENLIIAEDQGKPVGFYLWYPDFNQLITTRRDFNPLDVMKYRLFNPIDTIRFTEIGILPEYQNTAVGYALIDKALPSILQGGYTYCEGGFIFEENIRSMAFVKGILRRCFGQNPEPYRTYAVYETHL